MTRCFRCADNKVSPEEFADKENVAVRKLFKKNGWSCPWHPLQFLAWAMMLGFSVCYYGVMVAYLPLEWTPSGYIIPGILFGMHLLFHFICVTIDPADAAVKNSDVGKLPFDRSKRDHVIENCHCYICQTYVHKSSKHCSVCNKCISQFDHHCKWLNNCIGGNNYKLFMGCIISAFFSVLSLFIVALFQFVLILHEDATLLSYHNSRQWVIFVAATKDGYVVFLSVFGLLLLVAVLLLAHLILFHIYLIRSNLTTYDYIVKLRDRNLAPEQGEYSDDAPGIPPRKPLSMTHADAPTPDTEDAATGHCSRDGMDRDAAAAQQHRDQESCGDRVDACAKQTLMSDDMERTAMREAAVLVSTHRGQELSRCSADEIASPSSTGKENSRSESEESLREVNTAQEAIVRAELFAANGNGAFAMTPLSLRPLPPYRRDSPPPVSGSKRKERGFLDRQSPERSSFKNSESRTELISRENSKKRSMKKKKKKAKGIPRDLPPIVGRGRPLPKLPTLDEERD